MGNSEVGHLTIGSGRILDQDFQRVNRAIAEGSFFQNEALVSAFRRAQERGGDVHLLGLVSYDAEHRHLPDHFRSMLELAQREGMTHRTWLHAFTDGRDVSPNAAIRDLAELPAGRIATVAGRYYAMDRDKRWERTQLALDAILGGGETLHDRDPVHAVQESYKAALTDEFILPVAIDGRPRLDPENDIAISFNFRPDRVRQLSELGRSASTWTMTKYRDDFDFPVAFPEHKVEETLAEVLAEAGLRQLHMAETEKYAHVTYFFDGGREEAFPGETHLLVPSRRDVASYDLAPAMSAYELTDRFVEEIGQCVRRRELREPDMVGHTRSSAVVRPWRRWTRARSRAVQAAGRVCLMRPTTGTRRRCSRRTG